MPHFYMIPIYTEIDTLQCSLTEDESGGGNSKKTCFMRLPAELRQKVYRELLGPFKMSGFQTNILRVSKGIHHEAVEIFYGENGFVMFHVHRKVLGHLRTNAQSDRDDFPSSFNLYSVTGADGRIGSEPALTVSIALQHSCSSVQDSQWQDEFETYVGFSGTLPRLCKTLTMCHIKNSLHLRLSLPPVEHRTLEGRADHLFGGRLDHLLDHFQECRGVGTAEILAPGGLPVETGLSSLMEKPLKNFDEILNRGRCYLDRVRRLAGRRPIETLSTLQRANRFFDWWSSDGFELSNETDKKWTDFWDMKIETSLLCAYQWLQFGEPKKAREVARRILQTYPLKSESAPVPRRLWDKESEGHYILALTYLQDDEEDCMICALYEFLQALISKPGYEKADKEIDGWEAAIENSANPNDEIVRWNIKHVLGKFRHQPLLDPSLDADNHSHRGPAGMTADELYRLLGNFAHFAFCKRQLYDRR